MFERVENEVAIIERNLGVLEAVIEYKPVGLTTLDNRLSYPKHKIRYSLRILESKNLVESTSSGVTTTDYVPEFQAEMNCGIEDISQTLERLQLVCQPDFESVSESATAD
ncbi:hypothetical protein [Halorussus salinus]|uniref:hypothetical protein n=1 Tax=Halorussus salinus TaxID=1364935 RepID=UPI00109317C1|nr:hypothetical protein [Halorussus salinus]